MTDIVERLEEAQDHYASPWINDILQEAAAEIVRLRGEVCSCPSGDGSLRWPCRAHPPESIAPAEAKGDAESILLAETGKPCSYDEAHIPYRHALAAVRVALNTPQPANGGAVAWHPVRFGGSHRPSDAALAAAFWEHRQRENATPVDLCDSKLVKFGNDIVQRARELAPHLAAHPPACELGAVRALIERWRGWTGQYDGGDEAIRDCIEELENTLRIRPSALQHRGDSRGGEGRS